MTDLHSQILPRLVIFAKAPIEGHVKTRLQTRYSQTQATAVHRALVEHCLRTLSDDKGFAVELWVGSEHPWWSELASRYAVSIHLQQGSDLGERMMCAANSALTRSEEVLIIGTDCPFLTTEFLNGALEQLKGSSSVVLGPAEDGGYVMLGLKSVYPELFQSITWGSDQVLEQTRHAMRGLNLSWYEMPELKDVDHPEDVDFVKQKLPQLAEQFGV